MRHILVSMAVLLISVDAFAAVDYDAGILTIEGVQVFQDADDPMAFYYLPQYPRVSRNEAGELQFLLQKQIGGSAPGGLFHTLLEFTLDEEVVERIQLELEQRRPGATLMGALPLLQPKADDAVGGFRVISATLDPNSPPDRLTGRVITSGAAPLRPGSRVAIASKLSQADATVLMDSMMGTTSDLSVAIRGYYEAKVEPYNAVVTAEMSTIYQHRSIVDNLTKGFTKREARRVVDELQQDGVINVQAYDATDAFDIEDEANLSRILDVVTDKLIEVMFDTETGWSKTPAPEVVLAQNQIMGRQEKGWFGKIFGGPSDEPYYTDDQYTIKNIENIRSNSFYLNLSQTTLIRVPFDTTGNIGGFYDAVSDEERAKMFKIVDLDGDTDIEQLQVQFALDGDAAVGFGNTFNFVAVNARRKPDGERDAQTANLHLLASEASSGQAMKTFTLSREGDPTDSWREYEYQVAWSIRGDGGTIRQPGHVDQWLSGTDSIIALKSPLTRRSILVLADTAEFRKKNVVAAVLQVMSEVGGDIRFLSETRLLASEGDPTKEPVVYHDPGASVGYRIIWHTRDGKRASADPRLLDGNLINIVPPSEEWLEENAR